MLAISVTSLNCVPASGGVTDAQVSPFQCAMRLAPAAHASFGEAAEAATSSPFKLANDPGVWMENTGAAAAAPIIVHAAIAVLAANFARRRGSSGYAGWCR